MKEKMMSLLLLVFICVGFPLLAQTGKFDSMIVEQKSLQLMPQENINGLTLAVIENGQIIHVAAYSHRNLGKKLPLTIDTIMYGASLTKTPFAYMVMQLVDEGRFDFDASVAELLPKPLPEYNQGDDDYSDLARDDRWKALTPRIILNHTTGFANFRWLEPDQKLRFRAAPVSRYGYSGEGFYILQLILEKGLGLELGKEMQTRVFDRFGIKNTCLMWLADFAKNLKDSYAIDGSFQPHGERSGPRPPAQWISVLLIRHYFGQE